VGRGEVSSGGCSDEDRDGDGSGDAIRGNGRNPGRLFGRSENAEGGGNDGTARLSAMTTRRYAPAIAGRRSAATIVSAIEAATTLPGGGCNDRNEAVATTGSGRRGRCCGRANARGCAPDPRGDGVEDNATARAALAARTVTTPAGGAATVLRTRTAEDARGGGLCRRRCDGAKTATVAQRVARLAREEDAVGFAASEIAAARRAAAIDVRARSAGAARAR
jgi:hypothetical protein